jgi:hypothetical protein
MKVIVDYSLWEYQLTLSVFFEQLKPVTLIQYHPVLLIAILFGIWTFNWFVNSVWWERFLTPNFLNKRNFENER